MFASHGRDQPPTTQKSVRALPARVESAKRRTPPDPSNEGSRDRAAYPDSGRRGSRSPQNRRSAETHPLGDRRGRGALRSGRLLRTWAHLPCGPWRSERSAASRRARAGARPRQRRAAPREETAAGLSGAGTASGYSRATEHAGEGPCSFAHRCSHCCQLHPAGGAERGDADAHAGTDAGSSADDCADYGRACRRPPGRRADTPGRAAAAATAARLSCAAPARARRRA